MKILISACLLGVACRYDGKSKAYPKIDQLQEKHTLIPFCPEIYGGLSTPRAKAECRGDKVINCRNEDVTAAYQKGAQEALRLIQTLNIDCAVLKSKSPSCGIGQIYDGTFSGTLTEKNGVTAQCFIDHNIVLYDETQLDILCNFDEVNL